MRRLLVRLAGVTVLAALLPGCTFAQRTSVAMLDGNAAPPAAGVGPVSLRAKTRSIEVYQQGKKPTRAYREIALFTVDGEGREEADALQGFMDLGRKCGADAILMDRTMTLQKESGGKVVDSQSKESVAGGAAETIYYPNARCVFRATAVVWTEEKKGLSVAQ